MQQQEAQSDVKPWLVDEKEFPREGTTEEQLQFLLRYAVLAQSYFNSQPWEFALEGKQINVYVNKSHWLKAADPEQREMYLSVGCALENLLIAAEHFKFGHQISHFPDLNNDEWVARVNFTTIDQSSALRAPELFDAITRRHTHHHPFQTTPINKSDLERIRKFLTEEDIRLNVSDDSKIKERISQLSMHANTILYADSQFCKELRIWAHKGNIGLPWFLHESEQLDDETLRTAEKSLNAQEQKIITSAPLVAVLSSPFDNRVTQVKTGQIFEKLCLEAALLGIRCLPINQLIEVPEERESVLRMFPSLKGNPLVVFVMGYAQEENKGEWSPRLPLEEVIHH